ncbi:MULTISPECIES: hypothetical protein [Luteibacter]|uniref:hypothetical protein n=1 Tax=Luteibacter TaxID=242605 RepID=UPI000563AF48|nr:MULTISPECIES: hypothetical protein [unclassified Luteibacter]
MGTNERNAKYQALAERAQALVTMTNQLIADIESDIAAPADAAFHAKDAFAGLCRVHHALLDAISEVRVYHYEAMARNAQQAAA